MVVTLTEDRVSLISEDLRLFTRLKSLYFSLYEIEVEISQNNNSKKFIIGVDEYDYRQSLKDRQLDIKTKITNLVKSQR